MDEFEISMRIAELEDELDQLRLENDSLRQRLCDKKYRYQMITVYGQASKVERSNDISILLQAASIYLYDRDCTMLSIYDFKEGRDIFNYSR